MILRETYQVDSMENYAMAAKPSIDPSRFLHDQLASASPDLLRSLLTTFVDALMSADADAVCGAPYGMPPARLSHSARLALQPRRRLSARLFAA